MKRRLFRIDRRRAMAVHRLTTIRVLGSAGIMPLSLLLMLAALNACKVQSTAESEAVVARVGPDVITSEEFRLSYSFGFPHLIRGSGSPREAYLDHMIDERLLALQGYERGLDRSEAVQQRLLSYRSELLVEQLFQREVNDRVRVSPEQIREAVAREAVKFKFRYLPATSLAAAWRLRAAAQSAGFEEAASLMSDGRWTVREGDMDFESDYLAPSQIDSRLLEEISDLKVGEISEPIPFRGSYVIVQVMDVRRDAVGPALSETVARAEYNESLRQSKSLAREFVVGMMQPLELRIKGHAYGRLKDHLWSWYQLEAPTGNLLEALHAANLPAADSLRDMLGVTIMTTVQGDWTIETFLREYPADRYPLSRRDIHTFETDLMDAFGLTLRDRKMVEVAEKQHLDRRPQFIHDYKIWADKILYRAMLCSLADSIQSSETDSREYFALHREHYGVDADFSDVAEDVAADVRRAKLRSMLPGYVARLRQRFPVRMDRQLLASLKVDDPVRPSAPVTVFKGHTGRPAFPVVDPDLQLDACDYTRH